jgi:hypothetical protein
MGAGAGDGVEVKADDAAEAGGLGVLEVIPGDDVVVIVVAVDDDDGGICVEADRAVRGPADAMPPFLVGSMHSKRSVISKSSTCSL